MALRCEAGLIVCRNVAAGQCIVCGRFFCAAHGNPDGPHCRFCRGAFQRKQAADQAAAAEVARQATAMARNATNLCGWEGCDQAPLVLCQHCGLLYCSRHSNRYHYRYRYRTRKGVETRRAEVTLCDACKGALSEYKREKTWMEV
jgi:hypothetical protein